MRPWGFHWNRRQGRQSLPKNGRRTGNPSFCLRSKPFMIIFQSTLLAVTKVTVSWNVIIVKLHVALLTFYKPFIIMNLTIGRTRLMIKADEIEKGVIRWQSKWRSGAITPASRGPR